MPHEIAITYAIAELFCTIMLGLLLSSSLHIKMFSSRQQWFNVILVLQILYLFGDSFRSLVQGGVVRQSVFLVALVFLYLCLFMNAVSYVTFMYVMTSTELPFFQTKRGRLLAAVLPAAFSAFDLAVFACKPSLFVTPRATMTDFFEGCFLAPPLLYSLFGVDLILFGIFSSNAKAVQRYYLILGLCPTLMTLFGFIEFLLPNVPLYCFSVTCYLTFIYYAKLNSSIEDAAIDSLTGLKNRENFKLYVEKLWKKGIGDQFYLFMIDMNGLKSINDVYGHVEGDNAIKAISQSLDDLLNSGIEGLDCRFGGDEFLVAARLADDRQAADFAQAINERITLHSKAAKLESAPQVAVGYVHLTKEASSFAQLLKQADAKMYAEKRSMKNGTGRAENFFTDEITGLPNANYFHNFASSYMKQVEASGKKPIVVLCNISGMHAYNDRYGYAKGDELLVTAGKILREFFPDDILIRYTEDNFVLLTYAQQLKEQLIGAAQRLSRDYPVGLKAGIYYCDTPKENVIAAVDKARRAMRLLGSNRQQVYLVYDEAVRQIYENRDYVLNHFQEALDQHWIKAYYQPEIRGLTGRISGFEALARWVDPERGVLSPDKFIPALEDAHLVYKLDLRIIEEVCQMQADCLKKGLPLPAVSVNISRIDLQAVDIVAEIDKIRVRCQLPAKFLRIEILESAMAKSPRLLKKAISQFHERGYQVWMDDFGSSFSSLNDLKDFKFDLLKIDMGFLKNFEQNQQSRIILGKVVDMAKQLGITTLCEGVETSAQADFLKEIGCQHLQGYLFSKPMTPDQLNFFLNLPSSQLLEQDSQAAYYDQIDRINVLGDPIIDSLNHDPASLGKNTETPITIIELEKTGHISCLYLNQAFKTALSVQKLTPAEWCRFTNENAAFYSFLKKQLDACRGQTLPLFAKFSDRGQEFDIQTRWLASAGKEAYALVIGNFVPLLKEHLKETHLKQAGQAYPHVDKS